MYSLPEEIRGPYMLEVAREKALYGDKKKYILLVLLVCFLHALFISS